MSCDRCPCPGDRACPEVYCRWAAEEPPDEVKLRHVRARRGCGDTPAPDFARPAPDARPAGLARELVVCRFKEDLSWLADVPDRTFVSVLDKSDEPFAAGRQARRERLPNVGREAHSMLWHIVRYYDAPAEWTYFVQGDGPSHSPDLIGRLAVAYEDTCPLAETYSPTHPPAWIHGHDRVEWHGGFRVAHGDAAIQLRPDVAPWFNPSAWSHVFAGPMPRPLWFGYAAMYAVPRARILGRPRAFWAWLLAEVGRSPWGADEWTDPPLNPWTMEALWGCLLGDPAIYPHRPDRAAATPVPPAEAVALARRMGACPFRSTGPGCGCAGARCGLRGGAVVSHLDCFDCLRRYA